MEHNNIVEEFEQAVLQSRYKTSKLIVDTIFKTSVDINNETFQNNSKVICDKLTDIFNNMFPTFYEDMKNQKQVK